jgi:hypothetical protein
MGLMKITRYGLSKKMGGWDGVGDSDTDVFRGCEDNKLVDGISCALTRSAQEQLNAKVGDWLQIQYSNGYRELRRFDDRAPEEDCRLDRFMAYTEDKNQPSDFATVVNFGAHAI